MDSTFGGPDDPRSDLDADFACQQLVLDIWHPDCWTLQVTAEVDASLLGHGVYDVGERSVGRFTAFGNTSDTVDDLVAAIRASPLTDHVRVLPGRRTDGDWRGAPVNGVEPGNATQGLLVRYRSTDSISGPLLSRGFVPDAPVRIRDGREEWTVLVEGNRASIAERLDAVREESEAEVEIDRISAPGAAPAALLPENRLSERQRDAFEFARERGYYEWPRNVSGQELAEEWGVAKATFLEHLRKAEAKLLGP